MIKKAEIVAYTIEGEGFVDTIIIDIGDNTLIGIHCDDMVSFFRNKEKYVWINSDISLDEIKEQLESSLVKFGDYTMILYLQ